jgi:hypothetical protein
VPSLSADQPETRGNPELNDGFTASKRVELPGAHIGGKLDLSGASLTNPMGPALFAPRLTIGLSIICRSRIVSGEIFTAVGRVVLVGSRNGGMINLDGASQTDRDGRALDAEAVKVDHGMFCRNGFTATGQMHLVSAHIGGTLEFDGARISNPGGHALTGDGLTVGQSLFCRAKLHGGRSGLAPERAHWRDTRLLGSDPDPSQRMGAQPSWGKSGGAVLAPPGAP